MDRHKRFILPDAIPYALLGLGLALIMYYCIGPFAAILPGLLAIFTLYFFRNPERSSASSPAEVVSPADGVVLAVEEVEENVYLKGPAIKVSIFLNLFSVHVNRSPISGYVEYIRYQPGKFLPAFKGHASEINERNYVGIKSDALSHMQVLLVQITGFIARRIVCWAKTGDYLAKGTRIGLIKFGSCTEIYLPQGTLVYVTRGSKVKGGETVIGRLRHE